MCSEDPGALAHFIVRLAVAWIVFAATVADARAQDARAREEEKPPPDRPPPFAPLRYDEDYSYLRDPSARTSNLRSLEPIKFIPLSPTGAWYVSMGGEVRQKYELYVDLYYLGLDRSDAIFSVGTADEIRHTGGARVSGKAGAFDYNVEGMYQWGEFGSGDIRAWAFASDTGYTFEAAPVTPRIGLRTDVASGDRGSANGDLGTFNPLFPRGNYFGESATLGPMNLVDVHPILRLQFPEAVSLEAGWAFFWRQSEDDGIYGNGLNLIQAADGSGRRYVGNELSLVVEWKIDRLVSVRTSYALRKRWPSRWSAETPTSA